MSGFMIVRAPGGIPYYHTRKGCLIRPLLVKTNLTKVLKSSCVVLLRSLLHKFVFA